MAIELDQPITVQSGSLSGVATHQKFFAEILPGTDSGISIISEVGFLDGQGGFQPIRGVREDTGQPTPTVARATAAEWAALSSQPEWGAALGKAVELYQYIEQGRPPESPPAWLS